MRALLQRLIARIFLGILRLRYRIEVRGLERIVEDTKRRSGGNLFISSHPAMTDPILTSTLLWKDFQPRPITTEFVFEMPLVHQILTWIRGVPVPNFKTTGNALKKQRGERTFRRIQQGLKRGDNFIIQPAGRLKLTGYEALGGASWAHRLIAEVPDVNIVLVRHRGLWGSSYSRAITSRSPDLWATTFQALKMILKNGIFFAPRRDVLIEFHAPKEDFPRKSSRVEFNRYFEQWINSTGDEGPNTEPLNIVSRSMWRAEYPEIAEVYHQDEAEIDLERIPAQVKTAIVEELCRMTKLPKRAISHEKHLGKDLGLDSLDGAELIVFLDDRFSMTGVRNQDLTTVGKLMAIAAGQIDLQVADADEERDEVAAGWHEKGSRPPVLAPEGRTIQEAFLKACDRMRHAVACADKVSGCLTYRQLKMRVLLLAYEMRHLPGDRVGILLPASIAVTVSILACQLAGKVPVMINWTVGSRHLESTVTQADLHVILSSRKFIDELEGVELQAVAPLFYMLEDVRERLGLRRKIKAFVESYRTADALLDDWNGWFVEENDPAVVLFTSGTESLPKGVPLSHRNILSNIRASFAVFPLTAQDVLYGILPPFHSFGFTITGLLPILVGLKVVYSPNPTDGIRLARGIHIWGISLICSAPTFIRGILHAASSEQLRTVRLFIAGAEKSPKDLFGAVAELGQGKQLLEGYGITECSPVLACSRPGRPNRGVGQPLPNVEVRILDLETLAPLAVDQEGLIVVRGPNIFSGYLRDTGVSPFVQVEELPWYSTGDLGRIDEDGNLILAGRLKRFVKIGGEMVSLQALEEALSESLIREGPEPESKGPLFAIVAREEEGKKPELIFVSPLKVAIERLNAALRAAGQPSIARISRALHVDAIPITGTGKASYRALNDLVATTSTR